MAKATISAKGLSPHTRKEIHEAAKGFGFRSEKEFISQAIREKVFELKKMKFFALSEKVREGLLKKGIKPEKLLQNFKS